MASVWTVCGALGVRYFQKQNERGHTSHTCFSICAGLCFCAVFGQLVPFLVWLDSLQFPWFKRITAFFGVKGSSDKPAWDESIPDEVERMMKCVLSMLAAADPPTHPSSMSATKAVAGHVLWF